MHRPYLLAMAAMALLFSVGFSASVNASLGGFLGHYTNASATLSYSGHGYAIVNVSGKYLAVNVSPYSLVTDYNSSYSYFKSFLLQDNAYNATLISDLSGKVRSLYDASASGFAQCFFYTGLNATYLPQNSTAGCGHAAICNSYLANAVYATPLLAGITNLSKQYNLFNNSYSGFNSLIGKVNSGNYYSYASQLGAYAEQMGSTPFNLMHNPLFSVPGGFDTSLYKNCPYFVSAGTLQSFPWYCSMMGFCRNIAFNYTNATSVQDMAATLQSMPSNSAIADYASASVSLAKSYISKSNAGNSTLLDSFLNSTSGIVRNATSITGKLANATLQGMLYEFNLSVKNAEEGSFLSFNSAKASLSVFLSGMANLTSRLRGEYYAVYNASMANAGLLAQKQLDNPGNPAIATLSEEQKSIEAKLANTVQYAALSAIALNVSQLRSSIESAGSSISMSAFVKSVDSWFLNPVVSGMGGSLQSKLAAAPVYATVLSLIIGAVIVLIIFKATRPRRESHKKNMHAHPHHRHAKRHAWSYLFVALVIAVLVYAAITYLAASGANTSLPFSGFAAQVSSGSSAVIAVSSTLSDNTAVSACTNTLKSNLEAQGKNVTTVTETDYSCSGSVRDCLGFFASEGIPVILVNGTAPTAYRGLYGYMLYANESYSSGSSCRLAQLFK